MNTLGQISLFKLDLTSEFLKAGELKIEFPVLGLGIAMTTIHLHLEI